MFKVECPGCKAPYQVDERRVPAKGLKMRCPKCGTSFQVDPPAPDPRQTGPSPVLGAALGMSSEPMSGKPPLPKKKARSNKATVLGVAAPGIGAPSPPVASPPAPPAAGPYDEIDLPAVGGAGPKPPPASASSFGEIDLPAPAPPRPAAAQGPPRPAVRAQVAAGLPAAAPPAEIDLPAAVPPRPSAGFGEIDLPAPSGIGAGPADVPAHAPPGGGGFGEIDLPSVGGSGPGSPPPVPAAAPSFGDVDLPSVGGQRHGSSDADLPGLVGAGAAAGAFASSDADLPALGGGAEGGGGGGELPSLGGGAADLPSLGGGGGADLPSLGGLDLPSPGGADLPALGGAGLPALGGAGLPALGGAGLPALGGTDLPTVGGAGLPQIAAGLPQAAAGLPQPAAGLPQTAAGLPQPAAGLPETAAGLPEPGAGLPDNAAGLPDPMASGGAFGEADLGASDPLAGDPFGAPPSAPPPFSSPPGTAPGADPFGSTMGPGSGPPAEFSPPQEPDSVPPLEAPPSGAPSNLQREAGGGTAYGEVNLDGGGGDAVTIEGNDAGARRGGTGDDDMEFGGIPQEEDLPGPPVAATAPVGGRGVAEAPLQVQLPAEIVEAPKKRRGLKIAVGVLIVSVVGGAALSIDPDIGPFGYHVIDGTINKGKYEELLAATVDDARRKLSEDTFSSAKKALDGITAAQAEAKRLKTLKAYGAYVGYALELRFGADSQISSQAKVMLEDLGAETDVAQLELAQAAQAAAGGQLAKARQTLADLAKRDPKNIDVAVIQGWVELRAREPKAALEAWTRASSIEKSARTSYGLARAHFANGDSKAAKAQAEAALEANATHAGARIVLARVLWQGDEIEETPLKLLAEVLSVKGLASPEEVVDAQTLQGEIHLARSRISHAEKSFAEALKIDPKAARALNGYGDALYRAARYSEALARFEAAVQADADDIGAKIGFAKAKLALEQLDDAKASLAKLRETHPKELLVAYWFGKVQEAMGNRKEAEQAYREAVKLGKQDTVVVDAYVALALLLNQEGRADEAEKALIEAKQKLPSSPAIHKAFGTVALSQGRYEAAIAEFKKALELDKNDVVAKFQLGVALRKNRQFDEALEIFDAIAKIDRDYPGLALERGLLFQAAGRTDEALKEYEEALAKAPEDPDLMLRVGCGYVSAGRGAEAEKLLKRVLQQRPTSAEVNYCLGRANLIAENLNDATRLLKLAVNFDKHKAEYHLYLGWAANDSGDADLAQRSLKRALELDQGLADAYWQRGVLRRKQGAVKDAAKDLTKALELNPSRFEAHAELGVVYYDLGREDAALNEWQQAISANPNEPTWRFRYGKLLNARRQHGEAKEHLRKALELGEQMKPKPGWIWEAHRLLATSIGANLEAKKHCEAFLSNKRDSPYREECKKILKDIGHPWDGD